MPTKTDLVLLATEVGEALKFDAPLSSIQDTATSLFHFSCEDFPVEGITSERSKLIRN